MDGENNSADPGAGSGSGGATAPDGGNPSNSEHAFGLNGFAEGARRSSRLQGLPPASDGGMDAAASELVEDEDVPTNYHEQVAFNSHMRDAMAQMLDNHNVSNLPSLQMMLLESDPYSWAASLGREAAKALIAQQPHDSDQVTDQAQ